MEAQVGVLFGETPGETQIDVAGLQLTVDLMQAQKTGFYLDQLPHYESVAQHAKGRRVRLEWRPEHTFDIKTPQSPPEKEENDQ